MKHVAIIPARAGSKSILNKNLQTLGTKSLVEWAIDVAKKTAFFDRVILSTDIEYLLNTFHSHYKFWVVKRPEEFCSDEAEMTEVLAHLIESENIENETYIWLFQPTSPFRSIQDCLNIEEILKGRKPKSLISVVDVGSHHPNRMYTIKEGELFPLRHNNFKNKQSLMPIFIRNGCFYVVKCKEFKATKSFFVKPCFSYVMEERVSLNIDSPDDLLWARTLLSHEKH